MDQVQTTVAPAAQFGTTSLYVGDLDLNVTDSQLFDAFSQMGQVVSVRVCRDLATRRSLGYGYVNFTNPPDAARAIQELNYIPLYGKPIRVMYSHRDPSVRRSGAGNIFIKNLDLSIDHKALHDTFSTFGNIVSCKVAVDASGQSKGYGFVQYADEESAQKAIEKLNGMLLNDKQVYVGPFLRRQERDSTANKTTFTNVYVKNLAESTTDDDLKKAFSEYGKITSAVVMRDGEGKSKGFGFVNFENADDAAKAVESLNGKTFDDDKEWYVGRAQKKSERETELRDRREQSLKEAEEKFQSSNLYVKNLDSSVSDEKLKEMFSPFGTVTSCKVMRDPSGVSKGSGFVAFSTPEEATEAMSQMSGKMVDSKPLYVAIAQRKEDRRVRLQAQFSQVRPVAMQPSSGPRMPIFPPGGPGQQMFYGRPPLNMIPTPQRGYGYQQQLVPGMRPGRGAVPNYFMPMVQQQQQQQRPGGGRRPGGIQQSQQQVPMMQHQMHPRGRMIRYSQGRGSGADVAPYDMGNNNIIEAFASNLSTASPEQQRTMLGENLYPLVERLEAESAAKVTGMLLEMDQTEVLHLLESPEALKDKVAEAMDVLRSVAAGGAAEQLASLNLS